VERLLGANELKPSLCHSFNYLLIVLMIDTINWGGAQIDYLLLVDEEDKILRSG
jgi:hypothetical protein